MVEIFNIKALSVKVLQGGMLLFAGYSISQSLYQGGYLDDTCTVEESVLFPSPNKKWYANLNLLKCPDSPAKREVFLLRKPNDRIRLLVYSSSYDFNTVLNVAWQSDNELVIATPATVKPEFSEKLHAGVNVSYDIY